MDFEKVREAVLGANVNRAEYTLTQATCHKQKCKCDRLGGNGRPEDALHLIQLTILDDLQTLAVFGKTKHEIAVENARIEREEFEEWKRAKAESND